MSCKYIYKGEEYTRDEIVQVVQDNNLYVKGEYSKAKAWLEDKLGLTEDSDFELIQGLIEEGSFGRFTSDARILLAEGFEQGSEYHEAFHRVFNMYLSEDQKEALRAEFQTRKDKSKVFTQYKEKYPNLSDNDVIEEILSEEFRDYVLSNGKYNFPEKEKQGFFSRLFKFLKAIVDKLSNNISTQEAVYKKIQEGGFKKTNTLNYKGNAKERVITFSLNNTKFKLGEKETQNLMRGAIFSLLDKLQNEGLTFADIQNNNIDPIKYFTSDIYGKPILRQLLEDVIENLKNQGIDPRKSAVVNFIAYSIKKPGEFSRAFGKYLASFKIKLNTTQNSEESEDEEFDINEGNPIDGDIPSKPENDFRASVEVDPYTSISTNIKLLLATVAKKDKDGNYKLNELGLKENEDPQIVFMILSQNLAGIPADPEEYSKVLRNLSGRYPFMNDIIQRVGLDKLDSLGTNEDALNKLAFVNQFIQAFAKTKYTYHITFVDPESGNIYSTDAQIDNSQRKIRKEWQSSFNLLNKETLHTFKTRLNTIRNRDISEFAKLLQLDLTKEQLKDDKIKQDLEAARSQMLKYILPNNEANKKEAIRKGILDANGDLNYNTLLSFIESKASPYSISGYFENIAKNIALEGEYVNLQHFNTEGKMVYGISLNSFFTLNADKINYLLKDAKTPEEREQILFNNFPHLFTTYSENSLLKDFLIRGNQIKIGITDGAKNKEETSGTKSSDLKGPMRLSQILNDTLGGIYHFMQTGDRTTMNTFHIPSEKGKKLFADPDILGKVIFEDEDSEYFWNGIYDIFSGYLKDEVKTHKNIRDNKSNFSYINDNNAKNKLRFWKDVLSQEDVTRLLSSQNLDAELQRSVYKTKLKQFLLKEFNKYKEELQRSEVLSIIENRTAGLSNEYIDQFGGVDNAVMYSFLNQVIANIESSKIFFGDFIGFKNAVDIFKRLSQFNSTRKVSINSEINNNFIAATNFNNPIILNGVEYTYKWEDDVDDIDEVTLKDGNSSLSEEDLSKLEELVLKSFEKDFSNKKDAEKAAKSFVRHYTKFEEADGQSYVNIYFYRAMMIKSGAWDNIDERIFKKIIENKDLTSAEIIRLSIQKPNYLGPVNDSTFTISNRKTSYFPLIPQLIKGTNLEKLNIEMIKQKIDVVHMDSAAKFGAKGIEGVIQPFYKEDGTVNTEWEQIRNKLSWDYLGVQLDMNRNAKTEITEASQARKNLLHNIFDGGVPRDYKGSKPWNTLSLPEKLQESELARLSHEYNQTHNEYVNLAYKALEDEIGLVDHGNSYEIKNWKAFKDLLLSEATDRGAGDVVIDGLNLFIGDSGKANFINTLSNKIKIEQMLMSVVTNRIVRQKRFGDTLPQGSVKGFEKTEHRNSNGKVFYSSDVLKFHQPNEKGGVTLSEFAVPLPDEMIDFVNTLEGDTFEEKLQKFNDNLDNYVDPKVREFHGLRIPNQQYSSNTPGLIKFYLHPTANTIIVPSAFVKQTGSDFDIDKLFTYFKKFKLVNNKFQEVKFNSKYRKLIEEKKELQKYLREKGRATEEEASQEGVFDPEFKSKATRYRALKDFEKDYNEGGYTSDEREYLHNKLIDISVKFLTHPENVRQLLNPVDDTALFNEDGEGLTQKFLKAMGSVDKNGNPVMPDSKISLTDIFLPLTSHTKFKDFFAGVIGIGQIARHIPNHAITQLRDIWVNGDTYFEDHNGSIGKIRDVKGNWITETLSMLLTSQVDIGKNPYARYLGITRRTLNIITYLIRRGADYEQVLAFMQQPIIQKYIQYMEINESEFIKQTGRGKLDEEGNLVNGLEITNSDVVKRAMFFFGINPNDKDIKNFFKNKTFDFTGYLNSVSPENHSLDELLDGLKLYKGDLDLTQQKKLNNQEKKKQLQILAEFLSYTEQSRKFETFMKIANPDTAKEKDLVEVKENLDVIKKLIDDPEPFIRDFESKWLNNNDAFASLLNPYNKARILKDAFGVVDYIYSNPQISEYVGAMVNEILPDFAKKEDKERLIKAITSDFILRQVVRFLEDKYEVNVVNSLKGKNSAPKEIKRIKRDENNPLHDNAFINSVVTLIDNITLGGKDYDSFQTYDKKVTTDRANLLAAEIEDIRKHNMDLFQKLFYSNFAQSGVHNSPFQIGQFLPASDYFNIVNTALKQNLIDKDELDTFFEKFLLNRPGLLQKQTELELEASDFDRYSRGPRIYSIWDKATNFWKVKIPGSDRLSPIGNGFNLFNYSGNKQTKLTLTETTQQPEQITEEQPKGKTIAIIGTAGRSQVPTLKEWNNMLQDARNRVKPNDTLISGGAAFADHIAVKLFLEGRVKELKLRLPAKIENGKFVGGYGTAGGTANYYHAKFDKITGENSIKQIEEAINKGADVTYETEASNKAMFLRNAKVAKESDSMLAYTYGEGNEPADGGTKNTWDSAKYSNKTHISISKIQEQHVIEEEKPPFDNECNQ